MSDYEDDFEDYKNDTLNDRSMKQTKAKPNVKSKPSLKNKLGATGKDSSYDNTLARDKTLGIKPKEYPRPNKKPDLNPSAPGTIKPKTKKLSKKGGIYSSTPSLGSKKRIPKKNLLEGTTMNTQRKIINFGLTKKAEQNIIPSKAMTIEKAEKLMSDAQEKIEIFKKQQNQGGGNIDEKLEVSIKGKL